MVRVVVGERAFMCGRYGDQPVRARLSTVTRESRAQELLELLDPLELPEPLDAGLDEEEPPAPLESLDPLEPPELSELLEEPDDPEPLLVLLSLAPLDEAESPLPDEPARLSVR